MFGIASKLAAFISEYIDASDTSSLDKRVLALVTRLLGLSVDFPSREGLMRDILEKLYEPLQVQQFAAGESEGLDEEVFEEVIDALCMMKVHVALLPASEEREVLRKMIDEAEYGWFSLLSASANYGDSRTIVSGIFGKTTALTFQVPRVPPASD